MHAPLMEYSRIPPEIMEGLKRYIEHGIETGGFLRAVLENKLKESVMRADIYNRNALLAIVNWLYNEAPMDCWGSEEKVSAWLKAKRLN